MYVRTNARQGTALGAVALFTARIIKTKLNAAVNGKELSPAAVGAKTKIHTALGRAAAGQKSVRHLLWLLPLSLSLSFRCRARLPQSAPFVVSNVQCTSVHSASASLKSPAD